MSAAESCAQQEATAAAARSSRAAAAEELAAREAVSPEGMKKSHRQMGRHN